MESEINKRLINVNMMQQQSRGHFSTRVTTLAAATETAGTATTVQR
jgi:hypothetical protein